MSDGLTGSELADQTINRLEGVEEPGLTVRSWAAPHTGFVPHRRLHDR